MSGIGHPGTPSSGWECCRTRRVRARTTCIANRASTSDSTDVADGRCRRSGNCQCTRRRRRRRSATEPSVGISSPGLICGGADRAVTRVRRRRRRRPDRTRTRYPDGSTGTPRRSPASTSFVPRAGNRRCDRGIDSRSVWSSSSCSSASICISPRRAGLAQPFMLGRCRPSPCQRRASRRTLTAFGQHASPPPAAASSARPESRRPSGTTAPQPLDPDATSSRQTRHRGRTATFRASPACLFQASAIAWSGFPAPLG